METLQKGVKHDQIWQEKHQNDVVVFSASVVKFEQVTVCWVTIAITFFNERSQQNLKIFLKNPNFCKIF